MIDPGAEDTLTRCASPSTKQAASPEMLGKPAGLLEYTTSPLFIPERYDVRVAPDIAQVALFQAATLIASLQKWQSYLPVDQDVNLVFATGRSQLMAIAEVARIRREWPNLKPEEQSILRDFGVDVSAHRDAPFDSTRIRAFHLDTILPQRREALHSYAVHVDRFCDQFGIAKEKRLLWFGDVKDPDSSDPHAILDASRNRLSDEEFARLSDSVSREGLLVEEFKSGSLARDHVQYQYLADMRRYLEAYGEYLAATGGAHILNFGVGSGYNGEGHIGFTEADDLRQAGADFLNLRQFFGLASHSALAGNIKANEGMHTAFAPDGRKKVGMATLAPGNFRERREATVVLTITGSGKASTTRAFCEATPSPDYPVTTLHDVGPTDGIRPRSTVIVGPTCFDETVYGQLPELFNSKVESLAQPGEFLVRVVRAYNARYPERGVSLGSLSRDHMLALVYGDDVIREGAAELSARLSKLLPDEVLESAKSATRERISGAVLGSKDFAKVLGLQADDQVLLLSPHLDDVTLALGPDLLQALSVAGVQQHVLTATPGDSAVSHAYALNVLRAASHLQKSDFNEVVSAALTPSTAQATERLLLENLKTLLEEPSAPVQRDYKNFNFWDRISQRERILRAKLAQLSLVRFALSRMEHYEHGVPFATQEQVRALVRVLEMYADASPTWTSPKQPSVLRMIKESIRVVEDQTAFMAGGVAHSNYSPPLHPTWYTGGSERDKTLDQRDVEVLKTHILKTKPKVIVLNGEGFMDHEAHCLTEMTTRIVLKQLVQAGKLNWDCKILLYRGVWDRTEVSGASSQLLVGLTEAELQRLNRLFCAHYRSQVPALVPDGGCPDTFFSERVIQNAQVTSRSLEQIVGEAEFSNVRGDTTGFLAFDTVDLCMLEEREAFLQATADLEVELERVRPAIERGSLSKVVASTPTVSLSHRRAEIAAILTQCGLNLGDVFQPSESADMGLSAR